LKVADVGEFALIDRIASIIGPVGFGSSEVIDGIGDDAAVIRPADGLDTLLTTDTLVDGVHVNLETADSRDVGYKALAVNLSDIAAMGGRPDSALITLGLRSDVDLNAIDGVCNGLAEAASTFGVSLVGGDLVRSPVFFITIALTGNVKRGKAGRRGGAKPGDLVMVTGSLGGSAAALVLFRQGSCKGFGISEKLYSRHMRPLPRLKEGAIAVREGAGAMQDISDGLLADVGHICRASKTGAKIDLAAIPVEEGITDELGVNEAQAREMAATGGEDYELIITAQPKTAARIKETIEKETFTRVTVIGKITKRTGKVSVVDGTGKALSIEDGGYDHFR
jgi:thiamine-monophosphate kinase